MDFIVHNLPPVYGPKSRVLLLGTMPSPKSREAAFYYMHPQNRFWRILAAVYDEPLPQSNQARADLILRHGLALWDVLQSCEITGASDASIRNPVANDIAGLIGATCVKRILTTGATAARLYRKLAEPVTGMPCAALPSPSAANARMSLSALTKAYRAALIEPPV